ncbi:hypothetical protein ACOME3_004128 [Neoechinorhynchus agilis]
MTPNKQLPHRPGPFKQVNKPHKSTKTLRGRRKSHCSVKIGSKPKLTTPKSSSKSARLNKQKQARQLRLKHESGSKAFKRLFNLIITVVPITPNASLQHLFPSESVIQSNEKMTVISSANNRSIQFNHPAVSLSDLRGIDCVLDTINVSDVFLLLVNTDSLQDFDLDSSPLVHAICCHSMSLKPLICLLNPPSSVHEFKRYIRSLKCGLTLNQKPVVINSSDDLERLFFVLSQRKMPIPGWRQVRNYVAPDRVQVDNNLLVIEGKVRGSGFLTPNGIFHITEGVGLCSLVKVEVSNSSGGFHEVAFEKSQISIEYPTNLLDTRRYEYLERDESEIANETKITVPEGTSAYQAAWLQYADDDNGGNNESEHEFGNSIEVDNSDDEVDKAISECSTDEYDKEISNVRHGGFIGLSKISDFQTVMDQNCYPPLYSDYIFQLDNYRHGVNHFRNEALRKANEGIPAGIQVRLYLTKIGTPFGHISVESPCVISLFPHEEKLGVCNYLLSRNSRDDNEVIESGDPLLFYSGFRKFETRPIFSESSTYGTVHRHVKFLGNGATVVASAVAPITFGPCPTLVFSVRTGNLVASGNLMNVDAGRVVVEHIVVSGRPRRINQTRAVVKGMFYNPEDVLHFKQYPLKTKFGRTGEILDCLGTQGLMKCKFNKPLKSNDVVRMHLYRRIFPNGYSFCERN